MTMLVAEHRGRPERASSDHMTLYTGIGMTKASYWNYDPVVWPTHVCITMKRIPQIAFTCLESLVSVGLRQHGCKVTMVRAETYLPLEHYASLGNLTNDSIEAAGTSNM